VLGKSLRATGSSERMIVLMSRDLHPGPSVEVPPQPPTQHSATQPTQHSTAQHSAAPRRATPRHVADTDVERTCRIAQILTWSVTSRLLASGWDEVRWVDGIVNPSAMLDREWFRTTYTKIHVRVRPPPARGRPWLRKAAC
jgi:hypothetical protein